MADSPLKASQLAMARYLRNPGQQPPPAGVELALDTDQKVLPDAVAIEDVWSWCLLQSDKFAPVYS